MKFKLELSIHRPLSQIWQAFDNPENISKWQPSLKSFERISGTQGQPGAVSKLTYKENDREFSLLEKVTYREEPYRLEGVYENNFADNIVKNTFVEQDNVAILWLFETEYKFKTPIMKIMGPLLKKNLVARAQRDMERFKEMLESG